MEKLDLTGLKCPMPVLKTQKALSKLGKGAQLEVITTDPMSIIDIPHFCNQHKHRLIEEKQIDEQRHSFLIEKTRP